MKTHEKHNFCKLKGRRTGNKSRPSDSLASLHVAHMAPATFTWSVSRFLRVQANLPTYSPGNTSCLPGLHSRPVPSCPLSPPVTVPSFSAACTDLTRPAGHSTHPRWHSFQRETNDHFHRPLLQAGPAPNSLPYTKDWNLLELQGVSAAQCDGAHSGEHLKYTTACYRKKNENSLTKDLNICDWKAVSCKRDHEKLETSKKDAQSPTHRLHSSRRREEPSTSWEENKQPRFSTRAETWAVTSPQRQTGARKVASRPVRPEPRVTRGHVCDTGMTTRITRGPEPPHRETCLLVTIGERSPHGWINLLIKWSRSRHYWGKTSDFWCISLLPVSLNYVFLKFLIKTLPRVKAGCCLIWE